MAKGRRARWVYGVDIFWVTFLSFGDNLSVDFSSLTAKSSPGLRLGRRKAWRADHFDGSTSISYHKSL